MIGILVLCIFGRIGDSRGLDEDRVRPGEILQIPSG
jgi:hypothetical protein